VRRYIPGYYISVEFKNVEKYRITVFWNAKLCSVADFWSNMKAVDTFSTLVPIFRLHGIRTRRQYSLSAVTGVRILKDRGTSP